MGAGSIDAMLGPLRLKVIAFGESLALTAGFFQASTRGNGLSFGGRACLALAAELGAQAVTTDRAWSRVNTGAQVRLLR